MSYDEDTRTYGETKDCCGCRFWSEMLAQSIGLGPIEAYCLSDSSPDRNTYVTGLHTCEHWASGHFGAVDEPPDYGEEVRAMYAAEADEVQA